MIGKTEQDELSKQQFFTHIVYKTGL